MLPLEVIKVDHVAMATWDVSGAAKLLTDVLGATFVDGGDERGPGFRWLQFALPNGKIEVLEPLHPDGFLYRFLTRRGEGLHHVTLYVEDLADSLERLRGHGYEAVDVNLSHESWKEAFIHPRDASGTMFQIAQTTDPWGTTTPPDRSLEEFLADRPGLRPD